jgi:hypothetical protein
MFLVARLEDDLEEFLVPWRWHAADVLRWAVTFTGRADLTDDSRARKNLFKRHVGPPLVAKVIEVDYGIT